jgi:Pentapeptide repeats (8 copies)
MPDELTFNQEQYDFLMKCSEKKDITEWNDYVRGSGYTIYLSLEKANLTGAYLKGANLRGADLRKADLGGANLWGADLHEADLRGADLGKAYLQEADLRGTNFGSTKLTLVNLRTAKLIGANLNESNITGTCLYGTSRDDWTIDGIKCDYIYWDKEGKERTPKDRIFRPGEFEALYKSLPTTTYYFSDAFTPITPLVMNKVVNEINQKHPQFELKLDSFQSKGTPHAVFTVLHKENSDKALNEITHEYEKTNQRLEGKIEILKDIVSEYIDRPQLIQNAETIIHKPGRIEHMGNTFSNITSGHDTNIATDNATIKVSQDVFNQIDQAISESDSSPDDKQDAKEQLDKMTHELAKPEPDKGRIKRCYDYVVGVIPKVAEVVPWGKLIEKTLGL